jgi:hypothetical protein
MLIGINQFKTEHMKTKIFIMITALGIFSFHSCTKETALDQNSIDLADDDAVSEAVFEDIFSTVDYADIILDDYQKGGEAKSDVVTDSCPAVTIDHPSDALWPKKITIDYGTGCTGFYDNTRSGKIIIVVTGKRMQTGSKRTITFDNYYFNGIKVEGSKVVENMGFNEAQHMVMSVRLSDGKLTLPDGKTIERSVEHQREWIAGLLTRNIWDDECLITGTATGVNINGVAYTNTITTALDWKRVCRFFVSGIIKIERKGKPAVELNFGTGECDALATVTMNGETREITLKFKHRRML